MSAVGRNDLCPCGSGKKYKKCCLGNSASAGTYTASERQSALERLMRFTGRQEFTQALAVAEAVFWGEWMDGPSADDRERAMALEMEVRAARDRREGRPAYDFTWMWAELGLERPG